MGKYVALYNGSCVRLEPGQLYFVAVHRTTDSIVAITAWEDKTAKLGNTKIKSLAASGFADFDTGG